MRDSVAAAPNTLQTVVAVKIVASRMRDCVCVCVCVCVCACVLRARVSGAESVPVFRTTPVLTGLPGQGFMVQLKR